MKLNRNRDLGKSGVYLIRNKENNKVYIGRSNNIYKRIVQHRSSLNLKKKKHCNQYFIDEWHQYGKDVFEYIVLEYIEGDVDFMDQREAYWMSVYDSRNREKGYNLRMDDENGYTILDETKSRYREAQLKRFENVNERDKISIHFKKYWKNNPEKLKEVAIMTSKRLTEYKFYQYSKSGDFIKEWPNILEILKVNPSYKRHNIYAVCSGEKPSMYGYKWKKVLINEDIVQSA